MERSCPQLYTKACDCRIFSLSTSAPAVVYAPDQRFPLQSPASDYLIVQVKSTRLCAFHRFLRDKRMAAI